MKPFRILVVVMLSFGVLGLMSILLTSTIYAQTSAGANSANSASAQWQIETVDYGGDVGDYTSLALDGNHYPHISYFDRSGHSVRYAYHDVSGWHTTTVDSQIGQYDTWPQLALESTSPYTAHILYSSVDVDGNGFVKYAKQVGASWVTTTVDRGGGNSIALDAYGNPHVVYIGEACGGLKYAYLDASGWHTSTVDTGCYINQRALALDQDGNPHIAYGYSFVYGSGKNDELRYAYKGVSDWITMTVDSDQHLAWAVSLALEPTSPYTAHISYNRPYGTGAFRYAYQSASIWQTMTVGSINETGTLPSLALDGAQLPHVSYYEWTNSDLKYAFMSACGWQAVTVDSNGSVGFHSSLKLDPTAPYTAHVSYYDLTNHSLKYASGFGIIFDHCAFMPVIVK